MVNATNQFLVGEHSLCTAQRVKFQFHPFPNLLLGSSARLQHLLQHIQSYNLSFAFGLMSLTGNGYRFATLGPYCFRISGQVYHLISQLLPANGDALKFLQIYLYDASDEIDAWLQIFSNLQKDIFTSLQKMLDDVNPYVKLYHST